MTTRDFCIKWLAYILALLPVWFLESFVLSRFPLMGVKPMLLPFCVVAVATLEGATAGAGFGLGVGLLAQYVLRQDFVGCFLCGVLALCTIDGLRIALRLLGGVAPLNVMLTLAGKEILWSLCFTPLVYLLFRWVFRRVPKATVL